ncbi:MAG: porin family protein [Niabella sp.]
MKNYFLLTAFVLGFASLANAQYEFYGRPVRLGFKIDPVISNSLKPAENGVDKDGGKLGINYGLMVDVAFRDSRGAFATGLEISHAAASLKYAAGGSKGLYRNEASGEQRYDVKLQYIQIPLTVKLKTNETSEGLRWWGQFGTYLGALTRARADISYAKKEGGNEKLDNQNIFSKTNRINMGLMLGAGGEYELSENTDLYFGLGYENGFTDVTSNKNWHDGKVALNRFAIRLGLFF